jgi:hypothetical protein
MTSCCVSGAAADAAWAFLEGEGKGQLDLPMTRQGGIRGRVVRDLCPFG